MTNEERIAELENAKQSITLVQESLAFAPPEEVIHVRAGESIQAAIDGAPEGATIAIEAATYDEALTVQKSVMLVPATTLRHGRAGRDTGVWITSAAEATITVTGTGITVAGLGIRNRVDSYDAVDILGSRVLFDRCTALGDPQHGMRRAWLVHGNTIKITGCYCDDVFNVGRDTCCIGGWDGGDNILVDDCFLCGGAEGILFGGADSTSPDRIPKHITITHSTLTKKKAWYDRGDVTIKNGMELKAAQHVYVADCLIEGGGVHGGQAGYVLLLTVRNQDGNAPWSEVRDVLIERCHFRYGGGGISFLGHDDQYPSGPVSDVVIQNCAFTDLDPLGFTSTSEYHGSGWVSFFNNNPQNVTMDGITASGKNLWALGTFAAAPEQPTGLVLRNWKYPETEYGWSVDAGGKDVPPAHAHLSELMPDLVYEVTATDPGATGYPEP